MTSFEIGVGDTGPPVIENLKNGDGTPINLTGGSAQFHLYSASGVLLIDRAATVVDAPNGQVRFNWLAGDTATGGTFFRRWLVTLADGTKVSVPNAVDGYPVLISNPATSPTLSTRLTCSPWCTPTDVVACGPCASGAFDPSFLEQKIDVASDILFLLSGAQFPGLCTDTIRPNRDYIGPGPHIGQQSVELSRRGYNDYASHRNIDGLFEILLPGYPVVSITQVKVDGVVVPAGDYKIIDDRWLARVDQMAWPSSQNLGPAATETGTMEVVYVFGAPLPRMAVDAAAAYACEIVRACTPGEACSLPPRTQSVLRQGLSVRTLDPQDYVDNGKTGCRAADDFIKAVNPNGLRERASIMSPDVGWPAHRMR